MKLVRWLLALFEIARQEPREVWLVDRDGRVYRPTRRVVLRART